MTMLYELYRAVMWLILQIQNSVINRALAQIQQMLYVKKLLEDSNSCNQVYVCKIFFRIAKTLVTVVLPIHFPALNILYKHYHYACA